MKGFPQVAQVMPAISCASRPWADAATGPRMGAQQVCPRGPWSRSGDGARSPKTPGGVILGGQALAVFKQELRFRIWKLLHGGLFYDAGNVFALSRQLALGNLRQSAGGGLRLMFPFGPVRLTWARVLNPREREARSRWVFLFRGPSPKERRVSTSWFSLDGR
jgi:Omp85 superfamily domain